MTDNYSGAYRRVSHEDAVKLKAAGEAVEWAEGCGYIVYDQQALDETRAQADQLAKAHGHKKEGRQSDLVLNEVAAERARQIAKGYDAAHDDEHCFGEIAQAAVAYVMHDPKLYPFGKMPAIASRREALIIATAMLIAEIERLDRRKTCEACGKPDATLHIEFDGFACAECQASWEKKSDEAMEETNP